MTEIDIAFRGVRKTYGDVLAVNGIDLDIPRGAFVSLLGPSGCGKTTSLRIIAGFEQPTSGDVLIGGESVVGVPAYRRPVNMVFQNYALFPHLSVFDNVAFGLRQLSPQPSKPDIAASVERALDLVRLGDYGSRRTWELSGGQQQRVALARALINKPKVLLLDEPLAALDRKLRRDMQIELQNLQHTLGITFVLVTHDQEEALSMSDLVCIMRDGRIVQSGAPKALYDEPVNRYVADFVGRSNFHAGTVGRENDGSTSLKLDNGLEVTGRRPVSAEPLKAGERAVLMTRPELISLAGKSAAARPAEFTTDARIKNRIFLGEHTEYLVEAANLGDILVLTPKKEDSETGGFSPGDEVFVGWHERSALVLADN
jgi:spermidine/putrescine transport system ATP-binding protein